jgi:uncharacterized protein (TIGR01777 family)
MQVLITGATGFIGRALTVRLLRDGHQVTAWVRDRERAHARLGGEVTLAGGDARALGEALGRADAVVNLAGAPIAPGRWTARRRRRIVESRVDATRRLVEAMATAPSRPRVLVSASAVGLYGDRGDDPLDEGSPAGDDFLGRVCRAWEEAAVGAEALGVRVVRVRLGVVLGPGGGFLAPLLPLFRLGLGAILGSGRQWLPWIHLDDAVAVLAAALTDPRYHGAIDLVAPTPVRMADVMRALGRATGRPVRLRVPAVLLRVALGEAAAVVLGSQRLDGSRLRSLGFTPAHPEIGGALASVTDGLAAVNIQTTSA